MTSLVVERVKVMGRPGWLADAALMGIWCLMGPPGRCCIQGVPAPLK